MPPLESSSALLAQEDRYRLLVDAVFDYAIYMIDTAGIVRSWNSGARRIKQYEESEILGRSFSLFYTEEDRLNGLPARALEIAATSGRFEGEGWRVRKDGTRLWALVVIDPIHASDGSLIGFAKVTRDLTERKQAQAALKEAREALYQSQKMESIGQLTGGIAHDFNNLLTVILGSLGLVKKRLQGDAKTLSLLDNAMAAAHRGSSLTQRMLAFARRQELDPKPVDVLALIRGMSELLGASLGANINVETRFPLRLQPVFVDPGQLEMAIMNLIINARDAMPGGGKIIVSAREALFSALPGAQREEPFVCICVADTGSGMDEATLVRAMEPFFTTKGLGKGTGLGLSMIHGLAEQSGGKLILSSVQGQGTTAELWLPVSVAVPEYPAGPIQDDASGHSRFYRTLKILFVDDDPLVLLSTRAMIEDLGHRVVTAADGAEALAQIQQQLDFDLVITDHLMPNMTGTELAQHISRVLPALPVVIASGFTDTPSFANSGRPRLPKPFNQAELARVIGQLLDDK
ncbi:PAS domain S-box protein [Pseudomonas sp. Pseu.R1]|uniref:hybrid sensor histidine kinase/response regulator n=1 Tax=Pseudomonas sp. Pseu.R1 TaxID=3379818 RepID=UPI003B951E3E